MPRISRLLGPSRQGPEECPAALLTRRFDASGQQCGTGERRGALQKVQPLQPRLHNPLDAPAKRRAANRHAMARWLLVRRRSPLGFASKSECAVSKAQKMSTRLAPVAAFVLRKWARCEKCFPSGGIRYWLICPPPAVLAGKFVLWQKVQSIYQQPKKVFLRLTKPSKICTYCAN
jgi:hypothetical protein